MNKLGIIICALLISILGCSSYLLKVKVGDLAPQFSLPAVGGKKISLKDFREKKVVVLSFVPAAWTQVCSDQWPGYNIAEELFKEHDAILLGITVDNIPTLFPGRSRWVISGFRSSPISGRTAPWPRASACCAATA